MKEVSKLTQQSINGGTHYHWRCSVSPFTSSAHATIAIASKYASRHVQRYPTHKNYMSIYSCTRHH